MIQVKEFVNLQTNQEEAVNKFLRVNGDSIEIVDIKYSMGGMIERHGISYSGVLIIYKEK